MGARAKIRARVGVRVGHVPLDAERVDPHAEGALLLG